VKRVTLHGADGHCPSGGAQAQRLVQDLHGVAKPRHVLIGEPAVTEPPDFGGHPLLQVSASRRACGSLERQRATVEGARSCRMCRGSISQCLQQRCLRSIAPRTNLQHAAVWSDFVGLTTASVNPF
jgi:hypothetical protein